MVVTGSR